MNHHQELDGWYQMPLDHQWIKKCIYGCVTPTWEDVALEVTVSSVWGQMYLQDTSG